MVQAVRSLSFFVLEAAKRSELTRSAFVQILELPSSRREPRQNMRRRPHPFLQSPALPPLRLAVPNTPFLLLTRIAFHAFIPVILSCRIHFKRIGSDPFPSAYAVHFDSRQSLSRHDPCLCARHLDGAGPHGGNGSIARNGGRRSQPQARIGDKATVSRPRL